MKPKIVIYWAELLKERALPPLHIAKIGAILKNNGFDVQYVITPYISKEDCLSVDASEKLILNDIESVISMNADYLIAVSWFNFNLPYLIEFSKRIKSVKNSLKTIIVGYPADSLGEDLKKISSFDYVLKNCEINYFFASILNDGLQKHELNAVCIPDYSNILNKKDYLGSMYIETSSGCNHNKCIFCSSQRGAYGLNSRSIESVKEDIEFFAKKYNISMFEIVDNNFLFDYKRSIEIAKFMNGLGLKWSCMSRLEDIDERRLNELNGLGCCKMFIGVESVVPATIINSKKHENAEVYRNMAMDLANYRNPNMKIFVSLMFGFPWENLSDFDKNMDFAKKIAESGKNVHLENLTVLPGTQMWKDYKKDGFELMKIPFRYQQLNPFFIRYSSDPSIVPSAWAPVIKSGKPDTIKLLAKINKFKMEFNTNTT